MISLDSVKFQIPENAIKSVKFAKYATKQMVNESTGQILAKKYVPADNIEMIPGLKSVTYCDIKGTADIEVSAKILAERYFENISLENICDVIQRINESDLIEIDDVETLNSAICFRVDSTNNLILPEGMKKKVISDLSLVFSRSERYDLKPYLNGGLVITSKQSSKPMRLILYDKYEEMTSSKHKKTFKGINPEPFKNVLRVESNHRQLKTIRSIFGLKPKSECYLMDILKSDNNPNLSLVSEVFPKKGIEQKVDYTLEILQSSQDLHKIRTLLGSIDIIKFCNYDDVIVYNYLKSKLKGNISRYVREFRQIMKTIKEIDKDFTGACESLELVKKLLQQN